MRGLAWAAVVVAAVGGCGKGGGKGPAAVEQPEAIYRRMLAVMQAADGRAQWAMLSQRRQNESLQALAEITGDAEKLKSIAAQVGITPEALKAMGPEEFSTTVMKWRLTDVESTKRFQSLGEPQVAKDGNRLRVWALTPDGRFSYVLHLVDDGGAWKVDEEKEEEYEVKDVGSGKK